MGKVRLLPAPPNSKGLPELPRCGRYSFGIVEPAAPYLVPLPGGRTPSEKAPTSSGSEPNRPKK